MVLRSDQLVLRHYKMVLTPAMVLSVDQLHEAGEGLEKLETVTRNRKDRNVCLWSCTKRKEWERAGRGSTIRRGGGWRGSGGSEGEEEEGGGGGREEGEEEGLEEEVGEGVEGQRIRRREEEEGGGRKRREEEKVRSEEEEVGEGVEGGVSREEILLLPRLPPAHARARAHMSRARHTRGINISDALNARDTHAYHTHT
eukprot:360131-Rhodomonas_salina.2